MGDEGTNKNYFLGCSVLALSSWVAVQGRVWQRRGGRAEEVVLTHSRTERSKSFVLVALSTTPTQRCFILIQTIFSDMKSGSQVWNENEDIPAVGNCMDESSDLEASKLFTCWGQPANFRTDLWQEAASRINFLVLPLEANNKKEMAAD